MLCCSRRSAFRNLLRRDCRSRIPSYSRCASDPVALQAIGYRNDLIVHGSLVGGGASLDRTGGALDVLRISLSWNGGCNCFNRDCKQKGAPICKFILADPDGVPQAAAANAAWRSICVCRANVDRRRNALLAVDETRHTSS